MWVFDNENGIIGSVGLLSTIKQKKIEREQKEKAQKG
jgi:hypothetical protein